MSKEIEIGLILEGIYLTVSGTYHPEDEQQMYDGNMEGYPGYGAEFELDSVKIDGKEIIDLISNGVYDEIIEKVLEHQH